MIEQFLQYLTHERNYSPHTVSAYARDLRQWHEYAGAGGRRAVDYASVSSADIRLWVVSLADAGDAPRTLRRKVQAVRALFRWLMRRGVVAANPAADVELARLDKPLPHFVRESTLDALLDSDVDRDDMVAVRDRLLVLMLYGTGMRRAELIGLLDSAVDVPNRQLRVHGKRDKDRVIPFGDELAQWITHYRELRSREHCDGDTFFTRRDGKPLYPSYIYKVVHRDLSAAGGSGQLSPHVLRHSFATAMLNGGAQLGAVKELLGHSSLATTQVYTHVTLSELKQNYKLAHPRAIKKGGDYGS